MTELKKKTNGEENKRHLKNNKENPITSERKKVIKQKTFASQLGSTQLWHWVLCATG